MSMQGISVASQHSINFEAATTANNKIVAYLTTLYSSKKHPSKGQLIKQKAQELIKYEGKIGHLSEEDMANYPKKVERDYQEFLKGLITE